MFYDPVNTISHVEPVSCAVKVVVLFLIVEEDR